MAKKASKPRKTAKKSKPTKAATPSPSFFQTPVIQAMPEIVKNTFGEHAVVMSGMVLVGGGRKADAPGMPLDGKPKIVLGGIVLADVDPTGDDQNWQRWDCDVILVPRRIRTDNRIYKGATVDQYITGGLQDERGWSKEVFPNKRDLDVED